jgi:Family of unknown function (DUF6526)
MAASAPQSYANHARFVPLYHFVLFGIVAVNVLWRAWSLLKHPAWSTGWELVVAIGLVLTVLYARLFALRAQDRVIRLEERMRLARLLPADLQGRIEELRGGHLVALRFAGDAELPELTRRVLAGELGDQKAIKQAIRNWRADHFRV